MNSFLFSLSRILRLEEQEKLVTAEGIYRRALSLDDSNPEAKEALHNITDLIQVSGMHKHAGETGLLPDVTRVQTMQEKKLKSFRIFSSD